MGIFSLKTTPNVIVFIIGLLLIHISVSGEETDAKVREFDTATIEKLGRELYVRDSLAAAGTDFLFATHPEAREMRFGGWITEIGEEVSRLHMLQLGDEGRTQGYVITFPNDGDPSVEAHLGEPLSPEVEMRSRARTAAIQAAPRFKGPRYNYEVLDDPDGEGFLVYALAVTTKANEIVVGGHSRVTVSADGETVESVDQLSKSLIILRKDHPEGKEPVGYSMSHVVSATPVETHVFLSIQNQIPFFVVVVGDGSHWKIENGTMTLIDSDINDDEADSSESGQDPADSE